MGLFNFLFGRENSRATAWENNGNYIEFNAPEYTIEKLPTGKWGIFRDGMFLHGKEYSRRRDAFRGADRAGILVG